MNKLPSKEELSNTFTFIAGELLRDGKPITYHDTKGYSCLMYNGTHYKAHRVIWKLVYGVEPMYIDHIDGDTSNNTLANLRSVTHRENSLNQKQRSTNTSGFTGVSWDKGNNKWAAVITVHGKTKRLGRFREMSDAIQARQQANIKYGFHENHGRK